MKRVLGGCEPMREGGEPKEQGQDCHAIKSQSKSASK
jgi:hypothetical protein